MCCSMASYEVCYGGHSGPQEVSYGGDVSQTHKPISVSDINGGAKWLHNVTNGIR